MTETIGCFGIPFIGTALGAAGVFLMRRPLDHAVEQALWGLAAGVMAAASVWSLLIPSLELGDAAGLSCLPAVAGFWIGVAVLALLDRLASRLPVALPQNRDERSARSTALLVLAVVLHNIPEGMAVGVICAGLREGADGVSLAGALALSLGIGIQNVPEGAIISLPLRAAGFHKGRAFWYGVLSGAVEPIAAVLTYLLSGWILPALPYLFSAAAGAMIFVVMTELIPDDRQQLPLWMALFTAGFTAMMTLDVLLG